MPFFMNDKLITTSYLLCVVLLFAHNFDSQGIIIRIYIKKMILLDTIANSMEQLATRIGVPHKFALVTKTMNVLS
jgi:hypothetical protein